jgi:hypothetical protein
MAEYTRNNELVKSRKIGQIRRPFGELRTGFVKSSAGKALMVRQAHHDKREPALSLSKGRMQSNAASGLFTKTSFFIT